MSTKEGFADREIIQAEENVRFFSLFLTIWSQVVDKTFFLSVSRTLFKHHTNHQVNPLAYFTSIFDEFLCNLSFVHGSAVTHKESFKKSVNN